MYFPILASLVLTIDAVSRIYLIIRKSLLYNVFNAKRRRLHMVDICDFILNWQSRVVLYLLKGFRFPVRHFDVVVLEIAQT